MNRVFLASIVFALGVVGCSSDKSLGELDGTDGGTGGSAGGGAGSGGAAAGSGGVAGNGGGAAGVAGTSVGGSGGNGGQIPFDRFTLSNSAGPCTGDMDCAGFIELSSDGTLRVDRFGELPSNTIHSAKVSQTDLDAAIQVLTATALVQLLDQTGEICNPPTDVYETMALVSGSTTHEHATTTCSNAPLEAARKVMQGLADKYIPASSFEKFTLENSAGPCSEQDDCAGSIELKADGTLRVDKFGELPKGTVHEAKVTPAELSSAVPVLTDPALVQLLDLTDPPCMPPTDVYEKMTLVSSGVTHDNSTTTCDNAPIVAARDALVKLANKYAP